MKVLDLQCAQGHGFEGWFGSQEDYDAQRARGLVTCPVCNDSEIVKLLSAPRLNLGHGQASETQAAPSLGASDAPAAVTDGAKKLDRDEGSGHSAQPQSPGAPSLQQMQAAMLNMVRHVMANTDDVGPQFAEEARKIHYGERQARNIRGQATREETEALREEGIEVMPLPVPENLKGTLQ